MRPVPGIADLDEPDVTEMPQRVVLTDAMAIALGRVHDQDRTGDPLPEADGVPVGHVVGVPRTRVVVELPGERAVLVPVGTVHGEMARLFGGQVRIGLLHAPVGIVECGIPAWGAPGEGVVRGDPVPEALVGRDRRAAGMQPHALDDHELLHGLRKDARIQRRDRAAHGVGDQRHRLELGLPDKLRDVLHVLEPCIAAAAGPLRVAVATQVGGHDVVAVPETPRHPVPAMALILDAVQEQHVRGPGVAPVEVVESQPLGEVAVRRRVAVIHRVMPTGSDGRGLFHGGWVEPDVHALQRASSGPSNAGSASSRYRITASTMSSRQGFATTCTPIGTPVDEVPPRTTPAGHPVRSYASV